MSNEHGSWIMKGLGWYDPYRIRTWQELVNWINEVGFLPFFANDIPGFSAEEHVSPDFWWTGDRDQDPWEWREIIAESGQVAYGKFFDGKAGFISLDWLPVFANYRRDGYDFDAAFEDGLVQRRMKKLMDCFFDENNEEAEPAEARIFPGFELKPMAGFGKTGFKNFSGCITELQMQTYLVVVDFRRRRNKRGEEYGMPVCYYERPEDKWGYDLVTGAYDETPEDSFQRIMKRAQECFPGGDEAALKKLLK